MQTEQMTEYVLGLVQRNRAKITSDKTHCAPDLPAEKVTRAIEKYAPGVRPGDVLVLVDTTVSGSGKQGALFTRDRIYTYWSTEGRHCFPFTEVTSVDFDPDHGRLSLNGKWVISTFSSYANQMVLVTDMLRQISVAFSRPDCQEYLANLMSHAPCGQCGAPLIVFAGDTVLTCQACGAENHLGRDAVLASDAAQTKKGVAPRVGNEVTLLGNIAWDVVQRASAQRKLDSRTLIGSRVTPDLLQSSLGESAERFSDEQAIVLMCDTLSGDAKEGLLLTDKRVYELHKGKVSKSIALDEVMEVSLSFPPATAGCVELNKCPFFTAYHMPRQDLVFIAAALLQISQERQERRSNDKLIKLDSREPREIIAAFKGAVEDERAFLSPGIPTEKLKNALIHYDNLPEGEVLALIDCTNDGSAKANLTLTADKIFLHRNRLFERGYYVIELRKIRSIKADGSRGSLYVDGAEAIDTRREAGKARLLALMIEKLCRTLHPAENPLVVDEEWPGVNSTEQVRATTCIGCGSPLEVKITDLFLRCQYCGCERLVIKNKL